MLQVSACEWFFGDSTRNGARVAACYLGAAEECKHFDKLAAKPLYTSLFSPSLKEEQIEKNKRKHGQKVHAFFEELNLLLFCIVAEIQSVDDRQRLFTGQWDPTDKRTDLLSRQAFVARSALHQKELYFDKMRIADLLFLPLLRTVRRRLKFLNEKSKLLDWKTFLQTSKKLSRIHLARQLEAKLPKVIAAVGMEKEFENIPVASKVRDFLTQLVRLLTNSGSKVDQVVENKFAQLVYTA